MFNPSFDKSESWVRDHKTLARMIAALVVGVVLGAWLF